MTKAEQGFIVHTSVRVYECKEGPVYEPRRSDLQILLWCAAGSLFFAVFFAYGLFKAFEVFLQKVGLGG